MSGDDQPQTSFFRLLALVEFFTNDEWTTRNKRRLRLPTRTWGRTVLYYYSK